MRYTVTQSMVSTCQINRRRFTCSEFLTLPSLFDVKIDEHRIFVFANITYLFDCELCPSIKLLENRIEIIRLHEKNQ